MKVPQGYQKSLDSLGEVRVKKSMERVKKHYLAGVIPHHLRHLESNFVGMSTFRKLSFMCFLKGSMQLLCNILHGPLQNYHIIAWVYVHTLKLHGTFGFVVCSS